jgi:hypothetical protein
MENELPHINKKALTINDLHDDSEEKKYWLSQTIADRLNAIEYNRENGLWQPSNFSQTSNIS